MWEYQARVWRLVDGDTAYFQIDLGFHIWFIIPARLADVNTHETNVQKTSEEYARGMEERRFVEAWLQAAAEQVGAGYSGGVGGDVGKWPLSVETEKQGKYGRYIVTVRPVGGGQSLNDALIDEFGEELRYDG